MKLQALYDTWQGHCAYCGVKLKLQPDPKEKRVVPTRDHFIPLSAGGGKGKRNHVLACKPCNAQKAAFDPRVLVKVWHQLDQKALHAYVATLDPAPQPGIAKRIKALLTPKARAAKKLN